MKVTVELDLTDGAHMKVLRDVLGIVPSPPAAVTTAGTGLPPQATHPQAVATPPAAAIVAAPATLQTTPVSALKSIRDQLNAVYHVAVAKNQQAADAKSAEIRTRYGADANAWTEEQASTALSEMQAIATF